MNCRRLNINVTIVDFLGHGRCAVRGVVNIIARIFNEFCCQRFNINLTESTED